MKILASWSSGKDSAWMVHTLRQQGLPPAGLLTSINEAADRVAMHAVRHSVLRAQAEAAALPLSIVSLPHPCSNEIYEQRMAVTVSGRAWRRASRTLRSETCSSRTSDGIARSGWPARV